MKIITIRAEFSEEMFDETIYTFPYLGQLAYLDTLDGFCFANKVSSVLEYIDQSNGLINPDSGYGRIARTRFAKRWFQPDDAWKTLNNLHDLMRCRGVDSFLRYISDIRDEVADECRDLRFLLNTAAQNRAMFRLTLEFMENPPLCLLEWMDSYNDDLYKIIRYELEAAGIVVRED